MSAQRAGVMLARDPVDFTAADRKAIRDIFPDFIDAVLTATARATFYNKRSEQEQTTDAIFERAFTADRGLFAAALTLDGATDYARQQGMLRLLGATQTGTSTLSSERENCTLRYLTETLPPQRMINMYVGLTRQRVNTARARKLVLRSVLNSRRLEWWAVKYRSKLAKILRHAWGERMFGILGAILAKPAADRNAKERGILDVAISRYLSGGVRHATVYECVGFIAGAESTVTVPLLKSFTEAKRNLDKGRGLPYEVLEGIRSRYHPQTPNERVLALTAQSLTAGQRKGMQRKAREQEVAVAFNPAQYTAEELYGYAYTMGMTPEIQLELKRKAAAAARKMQVRYRTLGIVVDGSQSMLGSETQPYRPMAIALALRDVLHAASERTSIVYAGSGTSFVHGLLQPGGDTSLAEGLAAVLQSQPDAVMLLTDGYENAPAGRVHEVMRVARRLGVRTVVTQMTPVFAAEADGIRALSDMIEALPVSSSKGCGSALLKALFASDPAAAAETLLKLTLEKTLSANGKFKGDTYDA